MAWLGMKPIEEALPPDHPWRQSQIVFGQKRPDNLTPPSAPQASTPPSSAAPAAPETEADGIRAEAQRRLKVRRQSEARLAPTPASSTSQPRPKIDLRTAYLATDFVFEAQGQRYALRVGEQNLQVRDLLASHGVQGAAYITASNPASIALGDVHNTLAMRALWFDLKVSAGASWAVYEGAGQDRAGDWPPEPSLMVLGIDRAQAEALGRRYGQYAIVWVDATGTPSLVELADLDRASRYPLKNPPFKWVELGFEWAYEWVAIRVGASRWRRILAGESIRLTSRAWNDGKAFTLYWGFDRGDRLYVSYGDGGTAYDGRLTGLTMNLP